MSRRDAEPDLTTDIGMLTAMVLRHPELNWDADARATAALHQATLTDNALRYAFNGEHIPQSNEKPQQ